VPSRFDRKRTRNILALASCIQLDRTEKTTPVWPKDKAKTSAVLPYKGWNI